MGRAQSAPGSSGGFAPPGEFIPAASFAFSERPAFVAGVSDHASHDYAATPRACRNCSAALSGPFCSQCGQPDVDYHRSFHYLFHDLLENVFHFEGKVFVTVARLLTQPGRLTLEFIAGRRASQLNPLRFYIFVSVLFFLGLSLLNHGHLVDFDRQQVNRLQGELTGPADGAAAKTVPPGKVHTKITINRDSALGRSLVTKLQSGELTLGDIWEKLEHRVPTLLFLGVPLFALFLKILYRRSGRYYVEHLIFSLHLHTWDFLVCMVGTGYLKLAGLGPNWLETLCAWALALWSLGYLFRSFRVIYGEGRIKTALKLAVLGLVHSFALLSVALLLAAGTVAWLAAE